MPDPVLHVLCFILKTTLTGKVINIFPFLQMEKQKSRKWNGAGSGLVCRLAHNLSFIPMLSPLRLTSQSLQRLRDYGRRPEAVEVIRRPAFLCRYPCNPALSLHTLLRRHVVPPIPKPFKVFTTYWPPPLQAPWVSVFFSLTNL